MRNVIHSLLVVAFLTLLSFPSQAMCYKRTPFIRVLEKKHKEQQVTIALAADGRLFELWLNPRSGSFTAMLTTPDLTACVIAAGKSAGFLPPKQLKLTSRFEF